MYISIYTHIQNNLLTVYIYILRLLHVYLDLYVYDIYTLYVMILHILQLIEFTVCLITCNL